MTEQMGVVLFRAAFWIYLLAAACYVGHDQEAQRLGQDRMGAAYSRLRIAHGFTRDAMDSHGSSAFLEPLRVYAFFRMGGGARVSHLGAYH